MLLRNHVRSLAAGHVVHILATDPSTERDFNQFCRFMGHEMVAAETAGPVYEFWIRKKA